MKDVYKLAQYEQYFSESVDVGVNVTYTLSLLFVVLASMIRPETIMYSRLIVYHVSYRYFSHSITYSHTVLSVFLKRR